MTEKQKDDIYYVCSLMKLLQERQRTIDKMSFGILKRKIWNGGSLAEVNHCLFLERCRMN